jgi:alkylhydroperoxidase family enzyme
VGRDQGVTEDKLRELHDYETSALFSDTERTVLRYADAMTRTPVDVPDDVFESIRALFNEAQIVELTSAIAWENYRARFNHALEVEAEGFSDGAFCPLPVGPPASDHTARTTT